MSTEIERRLRVLEKMIITGTPCGHPLPIVSTDKEKEHMYKLLDACFAGLFAASHRSHSQRFGTCGWQR
jgi:hypothetical protein